ncbi:MAG: hypothetical protein ACLPVW_08555 [Terriglobales bacterium]
MARMLDLIRKSQLPSNMMQFAVRGALAVPPGETIEILVHLALHNKLFAERARLTLAGWDEKACMAAAADPATSAEVLGYFISRENLRTSLLPALAENPSVSEDALDELAVSGSRSIVEVLLASKRVKSSPRLTQALQSNPSLRRNELAEVGKKAADGETSPAAEPVEVEVPDHVVEGMVTKYLEENAPELAAEKDKPFQPLGMAHDELVHGDAGGKEAHQVEPQAAAAGSPGVETVGRLETAAAGKTAAALAAAQAKKHLAPGQQERRDSTLQKISKLDIKGRIALAMRGNKEERSILIRDSTKLVSLAVLDSPKVSDAEVEAFALQKNVLEAVLRAIPMKRKYAKNYAIMRNLVTNPRTPIDVSLGLMKNLLTRDLKNLSDNKEVSDTIRKLALRMFKQKTEKKD